MRKSVLYALFVLMAVLATGSADPEPKADPQPARVHPVAFGKYRSVHAIDEEDDDDGSVAEFRQAIADGDVDNEDGDEPLKDDKNATPAKGDASSGRLFMKKFLLFKNMFGGQQQQPIIPIIITGGPTAPTDSFTPTTITTTGTIPTATGTITTEPITDGADAGVGGRRDVSYDNEDDESAAVIDEQALQAALMAGAQEYVVTDDEIKGTSVANENDDNNSNQNSNYNKKPKGGAATTQVNLRRRGAKRGEVISVRIPPKYRRYFQNGQRIMLNSNKRPGKRRVIRKRVTKKGRKGNNKNRRRVSAV